MTGLKNDVAKISSSLASSNGIEKARVTDDTFQAGNPGIGQFLACESGQDIGPNSDFGFSSFTAKGLAAQAGR